jgi:glycerophosphoryl diester phosphodiesterase
MNRIFKITIVLFIFFMNASNVNAQMNSIKSLPTSAHKIMVIAHRGDHTIAPENSILSIQNAIQDGADYVELDIRTTLDGRLVLMHDATVDRMTNGKGKINELSFDQIRQLKLYNKNVSNSDTLQVPSFEEALLACKDKINIYLDFKNANVQPVYEAILRAQMQNNMVVYINAPNQYLDWRKQVPSMPLILSLITKINDSTQMYAYLSKINIDILDGNWNEYTPQTVKAAMDKGVPVWADMQAAKEDPAYWDNGIILGLKGIQTDHPKELVQYVLNKHIR